MNISTNPNPTFTGLDPTVLHGDLKEVRKAASESIMNALTMLDTLGATGSLPGQEGAPKLAAPNSLLVNVNDLTLRIGLLQDALNELMQQVSKNEIEGRLNDLNRENTKQLDKIKTQMEEAKKEIEKQKEAEKKTNVFEAIGNFFKAVFDIISAVFTAVAALAYALSGNVVAAAGLFVASAALLASGAINLTLAIDSTIKAAGGDGFLSEEAKAKMNKATEILGYIALGASLISGLSVVVQGVRQGASMAAKELASRGLDAGRKAVMKEVMQAGGQAIKELMGQATKEVTSQAAKTFADQAAKVALREGASLAVKEVAQEAAKAAVREAVKEVMRAVFKPLIQMTMRQAVASGLIQGTQKMTEGIGQSMVADIKMEAAEFKRKADEAEAQAKAIQATIELLRKTIEQLQEDLEVMLESAMETVSTIFNAADESANSMKELMHFQAA